MGMEEPGEVGVASHHLEAPQCAVWSCGRASWKEEITVLSESERGIFFLTLENFIQTCNVF